MHHLFQDKERHSKLARELTQLQHEHEQLNARRERIYKESLEAAEEEKACSDFIANSMLDGPLASSQKIDWPLTVQGVKWDESVPAFLEPRDGEPRWVWVIPHGTADSHIGYLVGSVSRGVQARPGPGGMLHLRNEPPVALVYVPYLGALVTFEHAQWGPIRTVDHLNQWRDDEIPDGPWLERALIDVRAYEEAHPPADEGGNAPNVH